MLLEDETAVIAVDAFGVVRAKALLFVLEAARVELIDDQAAGPETASVRIGTRDVALVHADVTDSAQVRRAAQVCGE